MKITFRDKQYKSLLACYEENKAITKVAYRTVAERLKQGESVEAAFTKPYYLRSRAVRGSHTVEGVEYINLLSIARAYGISRWIVYRRHYDGFRGDELIPLKKRKSYIPPAPEKKKPLPDAV
jgi:hypothetical protein